MVPVGRRSAAAMSSNQAAEVQQQRAAAAASVGLPRRELRCGYIGCHFIRSYFMGNITVEFNELKH
jgi:hypothetical protein